MRRRGVVGFALLIAACASPSAPESAWTDAQFAVVVALAQSCTGDPALGQTLLVPGLTTWEAATHKFPGDAHDGCAGFEKDFGVVVGVSPACAAACVGDDARTCRGPYQVLAHCGAFNSKCLEINGIPSCVDPGSAPTGVLPCPADSTPICRENGLAERCWGDASTQYFCSQTLAGSDCAFGQCRLGNDCTPGKFLDGLACDGTALRVCVAGKIEKVDCTALGFTGCDPFTRGCTPNPLVAP